MLVEKVMDEYMEKLEIYLHDDERVVRNAPYRFH